MGAGDRIAVERRRERRHVMMARIAVAQALTGRKVATPELRFVDGAVFLGLLKVAQTPPLF